jgi:alanyl-tRNA synthetase
MAMTERLYYTNPYLTEFEARVLEVQPHDGRHGIVLDRSAFYPTSGGQPFDTGTLGDARVVDVVDRDDGSIVHVVEGEVPQGHVAARVDWARRFEHMQQHTGQHVLSAAFDRQCGVRTTSFHLGSAGSTIDLAREVTPAEIAAAEEAANRVVWDDRPVTIRFVDAEDVQALPLRKESSRTGRLRIIEVEGFDVSACGGTHVARTGAIGIITIASWERFRGGSRIDFRCGVRALQAHRRLRDVVSSAIKLVSVGSDELSQGIERLQAENRESKRRIKDLETRLASHEAEAMASRAIEFPRMRLVLESIPDLDMNGLKTIAQDIAARPGHAAVLCTTSSPSSVVIARAADVPLDAADLLKRLVGEFGGKGGGRSELAQGGGLAIEPAKILAAARAILGVPA